jgi:hypothetical protein
MQCGHIGSSNISGSDRSSGNSSSDSGSENNSAVTAHRVLPKLWRCAAPILWRRDSTGALVATGFELSSGGREFGRNKFSATLRLDAYKGVHRSEARVA